MDLFKDIIPSIQQTKKVIVTAENEKEYVPYVVNRSLSYHLDMLMPANQMNLYPSTDGLLQYHYLMGAIRGYKRKFQSWQKKDKIENIDLIKEYYGFSNEKAKDALSLLSESQVEHIRQSLNRGGLKKPKR